MFKQIDYVIILIPIILGYSVSFICNPSKSGDNLMIASNKNVPRVTFAIVWPVLYILIGLAWAYSRKSNVSNVLFILLNILLCSWLILNSCLNYKIASNYVLILSLLVSFLCYTSVGLTSKIFNKSVNNLVNICFDY